ncbi:MAG: hypothetical protein J6A55_01550 [Oscillospiraceae bacterium]|nr:hypothetical protein [Oscillospiraceae bacterium]
MNVLYSYPSNADKAIIRREMPQRLAARKKLSRKLITAVTVSIVIAVIAVFSGNVLATVLLLILSAVSAAVSIFSVKLSLLSFEEEQTSVTESHISHTTTFLSGVKRRYEIDISKISKTTQNTVGDLVIELGDESGAEVVDIKKDREIIKPKSKTVTMVLRTTKTKLFLVNEMSEALHYPKKNYRVIEDDDLDDFGEKKHWSDRL